MKEFIPLEDDWSLVEAFFGQRLVPYQPGMPCAHGAEGAHAGRHERVPEKKMSVPSSQRSGSAL